MTESRFLAAPLAERPNLGAIAVVGHPFDHGTALRVGARLGPTAIRAASQELGADDPERGVHLRSALGLVDLGDTPVVPSRVAESFATIEQATRAIFEAGALPLSMGDDGMVSLPQLRAAAAQHPGLVTVHIDAHSDCYPLKEDTTATTFTHAAEEGLVEIVRSFHIGLRGSTRHPEAWSYPRKPGYRVVPMREIRARGLTALIVEVKETVGERPIYLCFDMDVLDASVTLGVCAIPSSAVSVQSRPWISWPPSRTSTSSAST